MLNEIYQSLDPIAFTIGPFAVRWYGIAYVLGFLLGAILLTRIVKRWKLSISFEDTLTLVIAGAVGLILGARLGYILFYGNGYYFEHPDAIFAIWNGGLSFHGGFVGLMLAVIIMAKVRKMSALTLLDLISIVAPIGLFCGRCANFINGELWGKVTDVSWGVVFAGQTVARHPSQLYEALLEGLVLFCILYALSRKVPPRPRGTFGGVFLLVYGICRFCIEFVRVPDAQIGYLAGDWFTMGQLLSIPLIIFGVCLLIYAHKTKHPQTIFLAEATSAKQDVPEQDVPEQAYPSDALKPAGSSRSRMPHNPNQLF